MKNKFIILIILLFSACGTFNKRTDNIVVCPPPTQIKIDEKELFRKIIREKTYYPLGVIGESEPVYLKDMNSVFFARIDTGAETSSIDAKNIKEFERDGESWVSFEVENRISKEKKIYEKKIVRKTTIKRQQGGDEKRITINMDIRFGNQYFIKEFTLANREKFEYQVLIGRNILKGLAVVDVSIKNSLQ